MWIAIATAACVVGAASKEIGVTAPAVVLAAEIVLPAKRWLLRGERRAFVALALLVLVLTVFLVAHAAVTTPNRELMGLIGLPASERIPTALALLVEYGRLAFFPFVLSADYTLLDLPLVHSLSNPRALGGSAIVVALAAGAWFARRRAPAVTWGVLATAITFAPVSNILFGVGIVVAERALYSPSIGLCVAVAGLLSMAWGRDTFSRAATVVFWLVVVAFAARTWTRNPAWRDNETLGLATIAVFPRSHIAHDILAQYYAEREDWQAAAPHVHASLATEECKDMRFIEGEIAVRAGRLDDAIQRYRMVIAADPGHQAAYNQLGLALSDLGRHDEAIAVFSEMQRAFPTQPTAWLNLVFLHSQRADLARALSVALDAVARFPDSAEVLRTAGAVHAALGNTEAAQDFARRAEAATVR